MITVPTKAWDIKTVETSYLSTGAVNLNDSSSIVLERSGLNNADDHVAPKTTLAVAARATRSPYRFR